MAAEGGWRITPLAVASVYSPPSVARIGTAVYAPLLLFTHTVTPQRAITVLHVHVGATLVQVWLLAINIGEVGRRWFIFPGT
jgi:hypothetical protein